MRSSLAAILLTLCFSLTCAAQSVVRVGSPAPAFSVRTLAGDEYSLESLKGRVVVITFWSTRCAICRAELPKVNQMIKTFEGRDVKFLALTTENEDKVRDYLRSSPQASEVVPDSFGQLLAFAEKDAAGNLNFGYPAFFVIDRSGRIAYKGSGWDRTAAISSAITASLGR
jgi:peroxiredoxin